MERRGLAWGRHHARPLSCAGGRAVRRWELDHQGQETDQLASDVVHLLPSLCWQAGVTSGAGDCNVQGKTQYDDVYGS